MCRRQRWKRDSRVRLRSSWSARGIAGQQVRRSMMRYMLLIYQKEQDGPPSAQEVERATAAHWAVMVDGPFAETKEQLAGYYILDCKDLDEAIGWASKIPLVCSGGEGCIEIRPIRPLPVRGEQPENGRPVRSTNG